MEVLTDTRRCIELAIKHVEEAKSYVMLQPARAELILVFALQCLRESLNEEEAS